MAAHKLLPDLIKFIQPALRGATNHNSPGIGTYLVGPEVLEPVNFIPAREYAEWTGANLLGCILRELLERRKRATQRPTDREVVDAAYCVLFYGFHGGGKTQRK